MEELKKNLFWIILGVVVLGALGAWASFKPDLAQIKSDALKKASELKSAADASKKPDGLKTAAHEKAADDMLKKLGTEKKTLLDSLEHWPDFSPKTLNARYADAPPATENIKFDNWMDAQRKRLNKKLAGASVAPPADFDVKLFFGTNIDAALSKLPVDLNSRGVVRHRDFQMRILAIMDEIVDVLVARTGPIPITKFETDPAKAETTDAIQTGALALFSFNFHGPEDTAKNDAKAYDNALSRSGWKKPVAKSPAEDLPFQGLLMPISITSVDVEFIGHISTLPPIFRKLESSDKYFAVLTKADCERISVLFPGVPTEPKVQQEYAKAAYLPMLNTHYGEAPVKAVATLEFYEFDKAKADKLESAAPAVATTPKAKPKP